MENNSLSIVLMFFLHENSNEDCIIAMKWQLLLYTRSLESDVVKLLIHLKTELIKRSDFVTAILTT